MADAFKVAEANIAHWDSIFASRAWGQYPPEELIRFVARTYRDGEARRSLRALEIGCGPGPNLWYLAREGFQVAGIDGSSHAIDTAHRRLEAELGAAAKSADLKVGNFTTLPWGDEMFDVVLDIEALSANPRAVIVATIAEVRRVMKPGAWFFSKMFGPETTDIGTGELLEDGTTRNPTEGPLAGVGVIHAATREDVHALFADFSELKLDWVHRSDAGGQYAVFEWLIQVRK